MSGGEVEGYGEGTAADGAAVDGAAVNDVVVDDPVVEDLRPTEAVKAASRLLEQVARDRGLRVRRLDEDLVLCDDGHRLVMFRGLAGSNSSNAAHVLCSNDAWLRHHLARHGLPVVDTRLADLADPDSVHSAAADLGFPVSLRLAVAPDGAAPAMASDAGSLHQAWQALLDPEASGARQVIVDKPPIGPVIEAAVVGREVLALLPVGAVATESARALAARAVATLPGAAYGSVRLVADSSTATLVAVDLLLSAWAQLGDATGSDVVAAILDLELSR